MTCPSSVPAFVSQDMLVPASRLGPRQPENKAGTWVQRPQQQWKARTPPMTLGLMPSGGGGFLLQTNYEPPQLGVGLDFFPASGHMIFAHIKSNMIMITVSCWHKSHCFVVKRNLRKAGWKATKKRMHGVCVTNRTNRSTSVMPPRWMSHSSNTTVFFL